MTQTDPHAGSPGAPDEIEEVEEIEVVDADGPTTDAAPAGMSRRRFLALSGGTVAAVGVAGRSGILGDLVAPAGAQTVPPLSLTFRLRRALDQVTLTVDCFNLVIQPGSSGPVLVKQNLATPAYLAFRFPSQHLLEQSFLEASPPGGLSDGTSGVTPTGPPVDALAAGESRLAFLVPDALLPLPYRSESFFDLSRFVPSIVRAAQDAPGGRLPRPQLPGAWQTALEVPYLLVLSPNQRSGWANAPEPVTRNQRTELWHTRLGVKANDTAPVDELADDRRTVRAVWSLDWPGPGVPTSAPPDPVAFTERAMLAEDRYAIVRFSSDWAITDYTPPAIDVNRLMLTSLGAWLDSDAVFDPFSPGGAAIGSSLSNWRHKATMGRDHYVRIVNEGFLFPFGHRAALIKVTERKFARANGSGPIGAYLRTRYFIVLRRPVVDYPRSGQPSAGRQLPFRSIRCVTLVSPDLDAPSNQGPFIPGVIADRAFVPRFFGGGDFEFVFRGTDWQGRQVDFTSPVVFVDANQVALNRTRAETLVNTYNAIAASNARRRRPLDGQQVAFAQPDRPDDTTQETAAVVWRGQVIDAVAYAVIESINPGFFRETQQALFYPAMEQAEIRLTAAESSSGDSFGARTVAYDDVYVQQAFNTTTNRGGLYLVVTDIPTLAFAGKADKAGGLATPSLNIAGLARPIGLVGSNGVQQQGDVTTLATDGLDALRSGSFDPAAYFAGQAKLLGGVLLTDVIEAVGDIVGQEDKALRIETRTLSPDAGDPFIGNETRIKWKPDLKSDPLGIFEPLSGSSFVLEAKATTNLDQPSKSKFEFKADLRRFNLNLIGTSASTRFLRLEFDRLLFTGGTNQKVDVDPDIADVEFLGPLAFVKKLQEYLSFLPGNSGGAGASALALPGGDVGTLAEGDGASAGPNIEVTPSGVEVGLTVALPALTFGVLNLQNISFSAGLSIPFSGDPVRFRFAFATREDPFLLTVYCFGGGGFFGLALGGDGMELLEASLEFGAAISIDLGVASGSVKVVGGFYFKLEVPDDGPETLQLTGYVRLRGELSVLGIVSLALEFYLELTYVKQGNKETVYGVATLVVEIQVLVFSGSVEITVEKTFVGGGGGGAGAASLSASPLARALDGVGTTSAGLAPGDPGYPNFANLMPDQSVWATYCGAFAPVGG